MSAGMAEVEAVLAIVQTFDPPGTFVPLHVHPKQDEFIYVLEGVFALGALAELDERLEDLLEVQQLRAAVDQRHHVDAEHRLHLRLLIEIVEHHFAHSIDVTLDQMAAEAPSELILVDDRPTGEPLRPDRSGLPPVRVLRTGGHTRGSQAVLIGTAASADSSLSRRRPSSRMRT